MLFAQQDSGKTTFHVVSANDKKDELIFSRRCTGDNRKMTVDGNGEANFYWGGVKNYNSSSFLADSALVDTVKSLITLSLINDLNNYCFNHSCPKSACNYVVVIAEKETVYSASIDADYADKNQSGFHKLDRLIGLLSDMNNKYAFPK